MAPGVASSSTCCLDSFPSLWSGSSLITGSRTDCSIRWSSRCALIVGGILILAIERWRPSTRVGDVNEVRPPTALGVGLAQILSLIPGTSRSGATIMGGYALGLSRTAATEFSFFLSIPVMFAATLFDLRSSWQTLSAADLPVFAVGFVTAFVSALVVVKLFVGFVSKNSFSVFAWYRIVFGILLLMLFR